MPADNGAGIAWDKLLLRRGLPQPGRACIQGYRRWVDGLSWPRPAERYPREGETTAAFPASSRRPSARECYR